MIQARMPQIQAFIEQARASWAPVAEAFRNFAPVLIDIARGLERLPEATRVSVGAAAQAGWFYDPEMDADRMLRSGELFLAGRAAEGDELLKEHFRGRLAEIRTKLVAAVPNRARFVEQAFGAHEQGEYALSIPLMLAQAEGASADLREGYFFLSDDKDRSRRQTAAYASRRGVDDFARVEVLALLEKLPIGKLMKHLPPGFDSLNRHAVMHGESLDYDTEANALKAVSLLNYIVLGID